MNMPEPILTAAIGACLPCRALFLVTFETPNCLLCGREPAYTLPFPVVPPGLDEPASAEPVEPVPEAVPPEEPTPAAEESPPAAGEEPSEELEPPGTGPIVALITGIQEFVGGLAEDPALVRELFLQATAEAEEAANAVGRLVAVRDLVDQLWERFQPEPTEPLLPTMDAPAGES